MPGTALAGVTGPAYVLGSASRSDWMARASAMAVMGL